MAMTMAINPPGSADVEPRLLDCIHGMNMRVLNADA